MKRCITPLLLAAVMFSASVASSFAQTASAPSTAQLREQAAKDQKYVFLVFYKTADPASQSVADAVKRFCDEGQRAACAFVNVTTPEERAIVEEFSVDRAPMPLVIAVAPTGAVTGAYPKKVTDDQLEGAFVTPAMAHCMKAMQDGRLAMLCVMADERSSVAPVATEFVADPMYAERTVIVPTVINDAREAKLFKELKIAGPGEVVLFAPPGALVGHFGTQATKDEIAAALHQAGKCCEDPNCQHNKQAAAPSSSTAR